MSELMNQLVEEGRAQNNEASQCTSVRSEVRPAECMQLLGRSCMSKSASPTCLQHVPRPRRWSRQSTVLPPPVHSVHHTPPRPLTQIVIGQPLLSHL